MLKTIISFFFPKKEKPLITVSTICQLVLQSTADSYDAREDGIKSGLITSEMDKVEAISALLAFYVSSGFEKKFSPLLTLSFLNNYCLDEIKEKFIFYYEKCCSNLEENLFNQDFKYDAIMDIEALSKNGLRLNLKAKNNPFKEPYRSIWNKNLP